MKELLEKSGFTNVVKNSNNSYDAIKDNIQYYGLYIIGINTEYTEDPTLSIDCSFQYDIHS